MLLCGLQTLRPGCVSIITGCTDSSVPGAYRPPVIPVALELLQEAGTQVLGLPNLPLSCPVPLTRSDHEAASRRMLATAMATGRRGLVFTSVHTVPGSGDGLSTTRVAPGVEGVNDGEVDGDDLASPKLGPAPRRGPRRSRWLEALFPPLGPSALLHQGLSEPRWGGGFQRDRGQGLESMALVGDVREPGASAFKSAPLELSFSSMFDYQWCPHRYYLRKVLGLPVFPTPAMVYGTGMVSMLVVSTCVVCVPSQDNT